MRSHSLYRPPGEAGSLVLRVADGCPWNKCTFCGMYKKVPYRAIPHDEWFDDFLEELSADPTARRVFLADGDVMSFSTDAILEIIGELREYLPDLKRVNMYANGASILRKSPDELSRLRKAGAHTLYMGLESGSPEVLKRVKKRETAGEMIEAARRASSCGLRMSVMVLAGLGGRELSAEHVMHTARVLNSMQPRLLSILTVVPVPGTALCEEIESGARQAPSEAEIVREIRDLLGELDLRGTVFRANHVSNKVPLAGRLPADRDSLVAELDELIAGGALDENGPGMQPRWL